jgi:hypothetical protein
MGKENTQCKIKEKERFLDFIISGLTHENVHEPRRRLRKRIL